ncbi:uncharacterized protein AMSG_04291 [Thecamonas trahens ATCC 50062]|uniref:Myosin motor domain-containing protein n=1 Tax=Thecamonas trahens ATCC 50062 TaxID=461836 RepID=A0A0L0D7A6_THETB|nr:hypothetical protein AMSG_04291 [Thecamonas trahens ATCC 50062]KNC48060.1 hypothetical protein AMSG_04291 [Thecamonas trahens ATCC 50062]|eukprot:XP_013759075.1 hypothetical protein AMSG_04291 [Thecamonas trahens ATCC 50062]
MSARTNRRNRKNKNAGDDDDNARVKYKWVHDDVDGFSLGEVVEDSGDTVKLRVRGEEVTLPASELSAVNPPRFDKVDDMSSLTHLSDATVLHNLKERYFANMIYTYSGLFCVVINPYKILPIYTQEVVDRYKGKRRAEIEPHVFTVADEAYRSMMEERQNQSMLITGESGAGKTVNTKKVIQYLAAIAGRMSSDGKRGELEEQLIQANPILESFGNAKTIRNDNSSRFGKFIEIQFTSTGLIAGGVIDVYLLEKSRIVYQADNERNFHIFYHLLKGAPQAIRDELQLTRCEDYRWLREGTYDVRGMDDTEGYEEVAEAWETMGVPMEEVMVTYRCAAAILHLGNATFTQSRRSEDAQADDTCRAALAAAEQLLGLAEGSLAKAILKPRLKAGGEWVNKSRSAAQAKYVVEALAKSLYDRLFRYIVARINVSLQNKETRDLFIGVLDISGFEIFEVNSFEQLCINYTNEKLQQFFNNHMFKLEQEEYMREQIEWDMIDFGLDLEPTIALIEQTTNPFGILSILDEQCSFPKASDETFVDKLAELHADKHPKFELPKFSKTKFTIKHYAGNVEYDVEDWLEKNRDKLDDPIAVVMQDSTDNSISALFDDLNPPREGVALKAGRGSKKVSRPYISQAHKTQLFSLMSTLRSTTPHFIRCIKPNEEKRPGHIDAHMVLDQLRCNGVLEGIRICRKGFPNRLQFSEFRDRYKILAPGKVPDSMMDSKKACTIIVEHVGIDASQYRVGVSKIFFKAGRLAELEELRDDILSRMLTKLQAVIRGHLARTQYSVMVENSRAVEILQRSIKMYQKLRHWGWWELFAKMRPMLKHEDIEAEMRKKDEEIASREARLAEMEAARKAEEERAANMAKDVEAMKAKVQEAEAAAAAEKARLAAERAEAEAAAAAERQRILDEQEAERRRIERELEDAKGRSKEEAKRLREKLEKEREELERRAEDERARAAEELQREQERIAREKREAIERMEKEKADMEAALERRRAELEAEMRKTARKLEIEREDRASEAEKRARVEKQKSDLENRLAELEADLEDERARVSSLESEKRRLQGELSSTSSRLATEESERSSAESQITSAQAQLNQLSAELADKKAALERATSQASSLSRERDSLEDELEEMERAKANAERSAKNTSKELADLRIALDDAERRAEEASRNARRAESKAKAAAAAAAESSGRGSTSDAEVEQLNAMIRSLREQVATLEGKLGSESRLRKNLSRNVDELQDDLEAAETAKADAERRAKRLAADLSEAQADIADGETEREDLLAQLAARTQEVEAARAEAITAGSAASAETMAQITKLQSELAAAEDEAETAARGKTAADKSLRKLKTELDEAKRTLEEEARAKADLSKKVSKSQVEIASLKEQAAEANRSATTAKTSLSSVQEQLVKARNEAEAAARAKSSAEKKLRAVTIELDDLKEQLSEAETTATDATVRIRLLETELRDAQFRAEEEEDAAATLRAELDRLRREGGGAGSAGIDTASAGKLEDLEREVRSLQIALNNAKEDADDERRKRMSAERAALAATNEAEDFREQLDNAKATIEAVGDGKAALERQIQMLRAALSAEQASHLQAQLRLSKMEQQAAETSGTLARLEAARENELKLRREAQAKLRDAAEDVDDAKRVVEQIERSKRLLTDEITALKDELVDAGEDLQAVEAKRRALFEELEELRANANAGAGAQTLSLQEEKRSLQSQLDEAKLAAAEANKQVAAATKTNKKFTADLKAVNARLKEESAKLRAAEKTKKQLKRDLAKAVSDCATARKEKGTAERNAAAATTQLDDYKARFEVLNKAKTTLEKSKTALENQLDDLRDALEVEKRHKTQQIEKRREYETELHAVRQQAETASAAGSGASGEAIDELKRQHILEMADVKKSMAADFAVQIETLESAKRSLRAKNEKLKQLVEDLERENSSMEKQMQRAVREAEEATSKLDDEIKSRMEFEKANRALTQENKSLKHKHEVAETHRNALVEEKASVTVAHQEASSRADDAARNAMLAEQKHKQLVAEHDALQDELDDVTTALREEEEKAALMTAELEDLRDQLAEEEAARNEWESSKIDLEDEVSALREQIETEAAERTEAMEESRNALLKDVRELSERCEAEEKQKLELEKANRRLENAAEDLRDEINALKRANLDAEKNVARISSELTAASEKLKEETSLRAEFELSSKRFEMQLKEATEQLADETRALENARAKSKTQDERLQNALLELDEERAAVASLHSATRELESELEDVRDKLEETETENRILEDAVFKLNKQIDDMHQELTKTDATNIKLEKANLAYERDLKDLQQRLSTSDGRSRTSVERIKARLESKVADLNKRLAAETKTKLEQQKLNRALKKEVREAKAAAKEASKAQARAESKAAKSTARLASLRDEYDEATTSLNQVETDRRKLQRDVQSWSEQKARLNDEIDRLKDKLSLETKANLELRAKLTEIA